jgi:hypothetical protein
MENIHHKLSQSFFTLIPFLAVQHFGNQENVAPKGEQIKANLYKVDHRVSGLERSEKNSAERDKFI